MYSVWGYVQTEYMVHKPWLSECINNFIVCQHSLKQNPRCSRTTSCGAIFKLTFWFRNLDLFVLFYPIHCNIVSSFICFNPSKGLSTGCEDCVTMLNVLPSLSFGWRSSEILLFGVSVSSSSPEFLHADFKHQGVEPSSLLLLHLFLFNLAKDRNWAPLSLFFHTWSFYGLLKQKKKKENMINEIL